MFLSFSLFRGSISKGLRSIHSQKPMRIDDKRSFLNKYEAFLFDCDGVIWKGDSLIAGVVDTLSYLRRHNKKIYFVTNNSTLSRAGFHKKFTKLGIDAHINEILSSSFAAALYLQQHPLEIGKKVYVVGHDGVGEELDLIGVPHLGGLKDGNKVADLSRGGTVEWDKNVGAVVVGYDKTINYYKIQYAQLCINQNPGCRFIATNMDALAHCTEAQEWAAGGAMVGAIRGCTNKDPILVGKPSPYLIDYIIAQCGIDRKKICMVGDRLDTDMQFGKSNGLGTVLTLSGVTTQDQMVVADDSCRPDYFVNSIRDFF